MYWNYIKHFQSLMIISKYNNNNHELSISIRQVINSFNLTSILSGTYHLYPFVGVMKSKPKGLITQPFIQPRHPSRQCGFREPTTNQKCSHGPPRPPSAPCVWLQWAAWEKGEAVGYNFLHRNLFQCCNSKY